MTGKLRPRLDMGSHKPWRPARVATAIFALSALVLSSCTETSEVTEEVAEEIVEQPVASGWLGSLDLLNRRQL